MSVNLTPCKVGDWKDHMWSDSTRQVWKQWILDNAKDMEGLPEHMFNNG